MKNVRRFAGALAALAIAAIAALPIATPRARAAGGGTPPTPACAHDLTGCRR